MLGLFFEGLLIAQLYWKEILFLLLSGLGGGAVCVAILYRRDRADDRMIFVLLSGFAIIGLFAPLAALLNILNRFLVILLAGASIGITVYLVRKGTFTHWRKIEFFRNLWVPIGIFLFFLVARLAFIEQLTLPPFSDSVEHYKRIASLLALENAHPINTEDFLPYYHWGFHAITAWVAAGTGYTHPLIMAVVAHGFLAFLPVTCYFMLLALGKGQILPALFGASLAAMGWVMPSHAINYGKYSALVSICMLPLLLGVLTMNEDVIKSKKWDWLGFLVLMVLGITWLHSRMGLFLAMYFTADLASCSITRKLGQRTSEAIAFSFIGMLIVLIMWIGNDPTSGIRFNFYLGGQGAATFLVFAILPFAVPNHARQVIKWSMLVFLLMLGTLTSLPNWVYHYSLSAFDQLFFDLILFLPFVVLGTLGMLGVVNLYSMQGQHARYIPIFMMVIVFMNGWLIQPWSPLPESNYVSPDDMRIYSWIENETAPDAQFVIASLEKNERYSRASDSGAWISVLTSRPVIKVPYEFEWNSPLALERLCTDAGAVSSLYVYVGHNSTSFDIPFCVEYPHLAPKLCYPHTRLFLLTCQPFYK